MAPVVGAPEFTPRAVGPSVHFHADGQSPSVAQVVTLSEQYPGKELMVVQLVVPASRISTPTMPASTATGADPPSTGVLNGIGPIAPTEALPVLAWPVPVVVVPLPATPLPEQAPITLGSHVNPSPQSALALHGSCHLNAHSFVVVVVHVVITGAPASHFVFGAQAGAAPPPEHDSAGSL
jgi:hypothetical protein